ncbi:SEC5 [Candida oxycetoniae]|uniref:Exocyst complex component SEC5 n=1 Tax=Candida oxycetoniae TaxID=497107 RepID=A0AAI9WWD8_9ASCO|nr:SEC5 [Candida oxycetoniae]KAI3403115.2 SEC5 [Candida oxycetoniae]
MLDYSPSEAELLATYGLGTLRPTRREDVVNIDESYPMRASDLTVEERFKLLNRLDDSTAGKMNILKHEHEHDLEDPLKGKGSNIIQDLMRKGIIQSPGDAVVNNFLVSSQEFNSYKYLTTVHKDTPLAELGSALKVLEKSIHSYTSDLRHDIEVNFEKFVDCKQCIDKLLAEFVNQKTKVQQDRENSKVFNPRRHKLAFTSKGAETTATHGGDISSELEASLNNLITTTSLMIRPISDNRAKEQKIANILEFIKANEFFFNLPLSLIQALSANDNNKFINEYNLYVRQKRQFQRDFEARSNHQAEKIRQESKASQSDSSVLEANLKDLADENALKKTLITTVFNEVDQIASQYRNKVHAELLSLDHEVNSRRGTDSTYTTDNSKFMTLVESLLKISTKGQEKEENFVQLGPITDFLNKQIEILDNDFEYQVGKFDGKFLLMQNKLIDYVASLKVEKRNGSHINYIADKYEKYKEDIKFAKTNEDKMNIIEEAFGTNDSLDLSLVNETWLVLLNFINYLEVLFLRLADKFFNNYAHYYRLGVDPNGTIRDSFLKVIDQVVMVLVTLFADESKDKTGGVQQLESSPSNYKQFVPCYANSLSTAYHLGVIQATVNKFMQRLGKVVGSIGNVSRYQDTNKSLKQLKNSSVQINQKILEAICSTWVNDCSQFYEMEDWKIEGRHNLKDGSCTKLMNIIEYYQLYMIKKIAKIVTVGTEESEFNIVANYPSKRILMSIEIQFMRTLNIVVDSMMKKYNIDRQGLHRNDLAIITTTINNNNSGSSIEIFKILTMNNFDKLSRITYPRLIVEFDKQYSKKLSKQNLKLFTDIDKASLTIIDDILNNEKGYVANITNNFFLAMNPETNGKDVEPSPLSSSPSSSSLAYSKSPLTVDGFVFEVLVYFVKLVHWLKPLTSEEIFVTILNELQMSFLKNILDNFRTNQHFVNATSLLNLNLDCRFIEHIFESSKYLKFNESTSKIYQLLLNEIEAAKKEISDEKILEMYDDIDDVLNQYLKDTAIQFNCF